MNSSSGRTSFTNWRARHVWGLTDGRQYGPQITPLCHYRCVPANIFFVNNNNNNNNNLIKLSISALFHPPLLFFWTPFFSLQVTLFFVIRSSSSVQERLLTKRTGTSSSWPQRSVQPVKCQGYAMTNILGELRLCKPFFFWQLRMKNWLYRLILFQRQVLNAFLVALQVSHSPECQDVLRFLGHWCGAPQNPSYSFNWVLRMFFTCSPQFPLIPRPPDEKNT